MLGRVTAVEQVWEVWLLDHQISSSLMYHQWLHLYD